MNKPDTIIIGAGHNGLVCACLLAKAGQSVLVLEASDRLGGLAAPREFHPGFTAPVASTLYAISDELIRELNLASHGFDPAAAILPLVGLSPEREPVFIDGYPGQQTVRGASAQDAAAFPGYQGQLDLFSRALAPFWQKAMPAVGDRAPRSLLTYAQLAMKLRLLGREDMLEFFRVATLPMRDWVEEHFDDELLKATLCWDGLVGSKLAPRSPNQAMLTLLARRAGRHAGEHGIPVSGVNSFVNSLTAAAREAGADIRTRSPVARLLIDGGDNGMRCTGVRLESGEEIEAERVVSSADPKTTFLDLLGAPSLEIEFSNRIRRLRSDGLVAKLLLALDDAPRFAGVPDCSGRMILAEDMDTIEFAFDDAKYGESSQKPVLEIVVPSMHDATLAPPGKHVLTANVMYVPCGHKGGWNDDLRAALLDRILNRLESCAPGIRDLTLHAQLLTPDDLARDYRVSGGHWHHGETAIDQLLMMRPTYEAAQYRTPIDGLFLCGAGSHPGGDLSGNPGRNAAREVLR